MKIVQLLSGLGTMLTNEESQFVKHYPDKIKISSLNEHDQWIAQGLVRKGIFSVDKDDNTLLSNLNESNT